jgi:hypothetical protein
VSAPIPGRPLVELAPKSPSGRSVPPEAVLAVEVRELAGLLAEVVLLAGDRAVFPGRLRTVAELALGHDSVRQALAAEETAS